MVAGLPASTTTFAWQTPDESDLGSVRLRVVAHDLRFQASSHTVGVTVGAGGSERPPTADTVNIKTADYRIRSNVLEVEATSTSPDATLTVRLTAAGDLIGTLTRGNSGRYEGAFSWPVNPQQLTVVSSEGGSDTATVRQRR